MWETKIEFYQYASQISREGKMWDEMRAYANKILALIPDIRQHTTLSKLDPFIDFFHLRLLDRTTQRAIEIMISPDDSVTLTIFTSGQYMNVASHQIIHTNMSDFIPTLETVLVDK